MAVFAPVSRPSEQRGNSRWRKRTYVFLLAMLWCKLRPKPHEYIDVGVSLVWTDSFPTPPRLTMMIVSTPSAWPERVAADAVGAAPATDEGVGRLAHAFSDRIQVAAQHHVTDPAPRRPGVLGVETVTPCAQLNRRTGMSGVAVDRAQPDGPQSEKQRRRPPRTKPGRPRHDGDRHCRRVVFPGCRP
jgi:hypothetical protein